MTFCSKCFNHHIINLQKDITVISLKSMPVFFHGLMHHDGVICVSPEFALRSYSTNTDVSCIMDQGHHFEADLSLLR
jgi:hypothetical protein